MQPGQEKPVQFKAKHKEINLFQRFLIAITEAEARCLPVWQISAFEIQTLLNSCLKHFRRLLKKKEKQNLEKYHFNSRAN